MPGFLKRGVSPDKNRGDKKNVQNLQKKLLYNDPSAVVWGGIEPPTQGFSVLCSTD